MSVALDTLLGAALALWTELGWSHLLVLAAWLVGWTLLARLRRPSQADPRRAPALLARTSVVVPARDEAHNLPGLLRSLKQQHPAPAEVIVVDDGSSDGTAVAARAHGATVIEAGPAGDGFAGKNWACFRGAWQARGETLVFLDADTRLEPGALARLVEHHRRGGGGMLTVEPHHRVVRPHEQLSAFFNIVRAAGTGAFSLLSPAAVRRAAFGPCLVVDRRSYRASGGHSHPRVRGKVLETVQLGRIFRAAGLPVDSVVGDGTVWVRMYPLGLGELVRGWSKAMASGSTASPVNLLAVVAWIAGASHLSLAVGSGLAALLGSGLAPVGLGPYALLYALFVGQVAWKLRLLGSFRPLTALLFPLPLAFFCVVFALSLAQTLLGRRVQWKGRTVAVEG